MSLVPLRILFLGDLCLAGADRHVVTSWAEFQPLKSARAVVGPGGLVVANVECCLSDRGTIVDKFAALRAPVAAAESLRDLDVALLANNHIGDYGEEASADSWKCLKDNGKSVVGWGRTLAEAVCGIVEERGGVRIGIINACCPTTHPASFACPNRSGVAPLEVDRIMSEIRRLRTQVDALFVCLHWGMEKIHYPTPEQIWIARRCISEGADSVIGAHAHVIQASEEYDGRMIFYGLGNYMFPSVPWRHMSADGRLEEGVLEQSAGGLESIGVVFEVAKGVKPRFCRIVPFRFDRDAHDVAVVDATLLAVHPASLTKRLKLWNLLFGRTAHVGPGRLFRSKLENGRLVTHYSEPSVCQHHGWRLVERISSLASLMRGLFA